MSAPVTAAIDVEAERAAWLAWYSAEYTSYIPLDKDGDPLNLDTLLSLNSWLAAKRAALAQAAPAALPIRADLESIDRAMQHMGDALNEMDACEDGDEEVTAPGFDAIARLLAATAALPEAPPVPQKNGGRA